MYDLTIIGGGPAGVAAGVYAARKQLTSVFIAETIGGQSVESEGIENWIGTVKIAGVDLAKSLETHLKAYAGTVVKLKVGERATLVEKIETGFKTTTNKGSYESRAVLVATGGMRRKLEILGAAQFENKGVTYCASCDGPLFAGQDVVVVGGGNAGFETAAQLLAYARSVTLVHRSPEFTKADPVTVEKVLAHPNMKALMNTEPIEVKGGKFMSGVVVKNKMTGETTEIPATGLFVEIGMLPATSFVKDLVELDAIGRVKVNPRNQQAYMKQTPKATPNTRRGESDEEGVRTSTATEVQGPRNAVDEVACGVWAAGDCTDELYHQNNIAAGDAVKALEDIYVHLRAR